MKNKYAHFKMKIKHGDIKKCLMIKQTLKNKFNIKPGKLLTLKKKTMFRCYNGIANENNVVDVSASPKNQLLVPVVVEKNDSVMFLDVVFNQPFQTHVIRYLHNEKIIGTNFAKGKTIKNFDKIFTWEGCEDEQ